MLICLTFQSKQDIETTTQWLKTLKLGDFRLGLERKSVVHTFAPIPRTYSRIKENTAGDASLAIPSRRFSTGRHWGQRDEFSSVVRLQTEVVLSDTAANTNSAIHNNPVRAR
jgi:hypothetical protein